MRQAASSSSEGKLEIARQEIAWLEDSFPAATNLEANAEPAVADILATTPSSAGCHR